MRVYISETALKEKPSKCCGCPICSESDDCLLQPTYYRDWDEQYKHCPLNEKRQPNPYNSVVALLRDFDIHEEPYIFDLADYICQLFKDGAYD